MTAAILTKDGYLCKVADGVDIHAYAEEIGGTVIDEDDYTPPPPSQRELEQVELIWRDQQLVIALESATSIDFGDETIQGTSAEWKAYWLALRKWAPGNADFPDVSKRPVAPT